MSANQDIDSNIILMVKDFHDFATRLSHGMILEFAPPFTSYYTSGIDILDFCHNIFTDYIKALQTITTIGTADICMQAMVKKTRNITVKFDLLHDCRIVSEMILKAIASQFKGFTSNAYEIVEHTMTDRECHLLELLPQLQIQNQSMFRVREGRNFTNRCELFHTPYELRTRCGSYRFSTLGYPSLYLAGSLETALREVRGENNPDNYSVSRFSSTEMLNFIDLSLPNRNLMFWEDYSLLLFYPLIIACALKVKEPSYPFKPEYILPQLLTQVIRLHSHHIDGISYTSTRHPRPDYQDSRQRNYVMFVPFADRAKGYSHELASKLKSTDPTPISTSDMTIDETEQMLRHKHLDTIL